MSKVLEGILLETSKDGTEGYITLEDIENEEKLQIEDIIKEIKEIFKIGLNENRLKQILLNNNYGEKLCIAKGTLPINGEDGYIKYYFDIEKDIKPKILENGNVDYKELDAINNVGKGDLLAEIIPPGKGKHGCKVTGEPIFCKRGKKPFFRYGKNIKLVKNETALISDKNGLVELRNGKIVVLEIFEVSNLDSNSGNIYFTGTVIVKKNALNGFQIKADGDVEINGIVEGAYIENSGDVIVKQGIRGYNKLAVKTSGNITTKFVEGAIMEAGRNIIAEAIMHSYVESRGSITVIGKKGLIVGGVCRARNEIKAKTIGSTMATSTILEVGIDHKMKEDNDNLKDLIGTTEDNLSKIIKSLELLDNLKKTGQLDGEKAKLYIKLLKSKKNLVIQLDELIEKQKRKKQANTNLTNGRVKVLDTIYPGVKISIGNSNYFVRDEMTNCTFYRDEGEIKVGPY